MKLINTKRKTLENLNKNYAQKFVFKGLKKNSCALILSPPDIGKSHLCLSMAIELATEMHIFGFKNNDQPLKVIYWPIEDGVDIAAERLNSVMDSFDGMTQTLIERNLSLLDSDFPIACSPMDMVSKGYASETDSNRAALINLVKKAKCDVLIIDTLREAVGSADEVEDDYVIKKTIDEIANLADTSIILVHHVTKNVAKGNEKPSSVSQSGLSRLGSKSKLHLSLFKDKSDLLVLGFTKANYLKPKERVDLQLDWNESGLLVPTVMPKKAFHQTDEDKTQDALDVSDSISDLSSAKEALAQNESVKTIGKSNNSADPIKVSKRKKNTSKIIEIPVSNENSNIESNYTKEQLRIMALKRAAKAQKDK